MVREGSRSYQILRDHLIYALLPSRRRAPLNEIGGRDVNVLCF
jgi:hypothetical protein